MNKFIKLMQVSDERILMVTPIIVNTNDIIDIVDASTKNYETMTQGQRERVKSIAFLRGGINLYVADSVENIYEMVR